MSVAVASAASVAVRGAVVRSTVSKVALRVIGVKVCICADAHVLVTGYGEVAEKAMCKCVEITVLRSTEVDYR